MEIAFGVFCGAAAFVHFQPQNMRFIQKVEDSFQRKCEKRGLKPVLELLRSANSQTLINENLIRIQKNTILCKRLFNLKKLEINA